MFGCLREGLQVLVRGCCARHLPVLANILWPSVFSYSRVANAWGIGRVELQLLKVERAKSSYRRTPIVTGTTSSQIL